MITRPMLAASEAPDIKLLKFPLLGSPKYDGIRAVVKAGVAKSRKFIDIPNLHIQSLMQTLPDNLDGEIMVKGAKFNQVQSSVMSRDGQPDFEFYVFDYVDSSGLNTPYTTRLENLNLLELPSFCHKVKSVVINNEDELLKFEEECLDQGFEGVMLRSFDSPYKCGRATLKQGWLIKLKQFKDSEAVIVGFEEQLENTNKKEQDNLGYSKRSSSNSGMVGKSTLGKFLVREIGETPWKDREFTIGTGEGLDTPLRQSIWDNKDLYLGKIITYKYQPHGVKDLPRIPIWKGFRDSRDM